MNIDLKAIRNVASVTSDSERMQFKPSTVVSILDRLEAAEKDAARMQWIVDNDVHAAEMLATTPGTFIRDQIDAAMKEQT